MTEVASPVPSALVAQVLRASAYVLPDVHFLLRREISDCKSVLDVGCGAEFSPFAFVKRYAGQRRIGIDSFAPSIERSRRAGIHDEYILADVLEFAKDPSNAGRFDCVVALDLIEHFEKQHSIELVQMLERLASKKVILFAPNGFLPQEPYDGNEGQRHLCGWTTEEFRAHGYNVHGAYGLKPLRGAYSLPTIPPKILGQALAMLSQPLALFAPQAAFSLFAVKNLCGK